jgi:hypothetical protein
MREQPENAPQTPTPATPQGRLGDVPTQQAVMGELLRGLGTHGSVAAIILYMMQQWISGLEVRISETRNELGTQIGDVRREVDAVSSSVDGLRVDVARLQAIQDRPRQGQ